MVVGEETRLSPVLWLVTRALLVIWLVVAAFPLVWMAAMSIRLPVDAFSSNPLQVLLGPETARQAGGWPIGFTADHYRAVWIDNAFHRQFVNSMIVTLGVVTISIGIGTLAAYGLARSKSRLAFWLLMAALIFRAMPHSVLVAGYLPAFTSSREWLQPLWDAPGLGALLRLIAAEPPTLYGKPFAVIMVLVAINQPFTIWMLRSFFMSIPPELDEAAQIDGCTPFGAFRRVILPVMGPGVLTTALFSFLLAYNDYLVAALLLDAQSQTMVPTISQYVNSENNLTDQLRAIAAAVSITAPLFVLVLVFQKRIVAGLTLGAVKG